MAVVTVQQFIFKINRDSEVEFKSVSSSFLAISFAICIARGLGGVEREGNRLKHGGDSRVRLL